MWDSLKDILLNRKVIAALVIIAAAIAGATATTVDDQVVAQIAQLLQVDLSAETVNPTVVAPVAVAPTE